jgi:hypothetical protein
MSDATADKPSQAEGDVGDDDVTTGASGDETSGTIGGTDDDTAVPVSDGQPADDRP